jgi:hypothetical protein
MLRGTWVALLSDSTTDARDRVTISGPIENLAGQTVAIDAADLWDAAISAPIEITETMETVSDNTWSGSNADGTKTADTCGDWGSAGDGNKGSRGKSDRTDQTWFGDGWNQCQFSERLYCISL